MTKKSIRAMMREAQEKGDKFFFSGKPCVNGHLAQRRAIGNCICVECEKVPLQWGEKYEGNPCKNCGCTIRNMHRKCIDCERKRSNLSKITNKERVNKWQNENRYRYKDYYEQYRKENKYLFAMYSEERKRLIFKSHPLWKSHNDLPKIKDFYLKRPDGMEIDHICPLKGKNICGLHVSWNLQYLTRSENIAKTNRFPYGEESTRLAFVNFPK